MKKQILLAALAYAAYFFTGGSIPFVIRPKVKKETMERIDERSYTGAEDCGESVRILADNKEALRERIRLISNAKRRVILSTFDFRSDESGKDILAALLAAAERGVSVRVVVDGFNGFTKMFQNPWFGALAGAKNAELRIYNPVNLLKPWRLMGRLHDKYVIADDDTYILGGRNSNDIFLGGHDGYKNYDWDVIVHNGREGQSESLKQLLSYFEKIWELPLVRDYRVFGKRRLFRKRDELRLRYEKRKQENPDWFKACGYEEAGLPVRRIELVQNPVSCYSKEPTTFYEISQLMGRAKEEVRFHTPYILCNGRMTEGLKQVCKNVPSVTMMTNSVANNANPFGALDYFIHKAEILETGVKVLEYDGGMSYHGKCFVVDKRLSGIGSFNWDMRSVYIDTELMLVIDSEEVNAALRREMGRYEADALPVADRTHYRLPEGKASRRVGVKKWITMLLMRLLFGWARFMM